MKKLRSFGADTKKLYKDISGPIKDLFRFGLSEEAPRHLADPGDDGSYADEYYSRIEGEGRKVQTKAGETAKGSIKGHINLE